MTVALAGELNFATAPAALTAASPAIHAAAAGAPLVLDLSAVTRADSAGLALLLELARMTRGKGATLQIQKAPPQLRKLANFFDLDELLTFA